MTLFFSHRPGFSNFPFLFPHFPYVYCFKCRIRPSPHKKNNFFYSVHTFTRIQQHYISKYLGDQCMGRPPPQTLGGPSPSPPRSPSLSAKNTELIGNVKTLVIYIALRRPVLKVFYVDF